YLDAPINLEPRDDPNDTLDKNGQRPYSIDVMWLAPKGFDPDLHQFQIEYATDRVMKTKKGSFKTPGTVVVEPSPQMASSSVSEPQPSETVTGEASAETTPESSAGATTEPAVEQPSETPAESLTPSSEASPSSTEETTSAQPENDPGAEQVAAHAATGGKTEVVLLSAPIRPAVANATTQTYWARVPSLAANTNWYMRVKIIRKSDNAVLSERSEALMVKTLSPKGYITGTVNLNGQPASDYVVAAYKGKDLHDQAEIATDGSYQLSVRPGSYNVAAVYIGSGNLSSRWASSDLTKGRTRYDSARTVAVTAAKATTGVNITPQSTPSYSLSGDIDCPGAASTQCTVDVAAMSTWGTSRVVNQVRSNSSGGYTVTGLPAGAYKLRISHADERYKVKTLTVTIGSANVTNVDGKLIERAWLKTYPAKIKRTGSTVTVTSKAYIASELPIVRAVQKCQWQRNGANIGGATSCTYKLKAADRGKSIRVRITNERYGFPDHTTYSNAVRG
ncbi:MAG: hypothetical protein KIT69_05290, partial [Propionibacteriaceae bacterium]|nr:hypothetical protein [Propionibacteriaceae bacterium]